MEENVKTLDIRAINEKIEKNDEYAYKKIN